MRALSNYWRENEVRECERGEAKRAIGQGDRPISNNDSTSDISRWIMQQIYFVRSVKNTRKSKCLFLLHGFVTVHSGMNETSSGMT